MSRVLNGRTDVDIDLTRRVHAAVQRLGYWPSGLVRSLRMRVTTVIEIIIADVANPFFTSMVRGVEDAAQAAGYSVVFASVDEDLAKEARYIEVAAAEQMAGVILCPASGSDTRIHRESFESFTCHHVLKGPLTYANAGQGPFRVVRL